MIDPDYLIELEKKERAKQQEKQMSSHPTKEEMIQEIRKNTLEERQKLYNYLALYIGLLGVFLFILIYDKITQNFGISFSLTSNNICSFLFGATFFVLGLISISLRLYRNIHNLKQLCKSETTSPQE